MASTPDTKAQDSEVKDETSSFENEVSKVINPVNLLLIAIIAFMLYKIYCKFNKSSTDIVVFDYPKLRKDMTVAELRHYDGNQPDGRVLVAVNGWIFDVTRGRRFYGPGGPYAAFGGKDASRGLATFSVTSSKEYDDLSDLNSMEMESIKEWEAQFREKYELVGRLLKPGEEPANYSDEETEDTDSPASTPADKKQD